MMFYKNRLAILSVALLTLASPHKSYGAAATCIPYAAHATEFQAFMTEFGTLKSKKSALPGADALISKIEKDTPKLQALLMTMQVQKAQCKKAADDFTKLHKDLQNL